MVLGHIIRKTRSPERRCLYTCQEIDNDFIQDRDCTIRVDIINAAWLHCIFKLCGSRGEGVISFHKSV